MKILLTTGYQTSEEAILRLVDWETKATLQEMTYRSETSTFLERLRSQSPTVVPPGITPKCKFNGGSFWGQYFYTCTYNEVVRIDLSTWTVDSQFLISQPTFNDLHYVYVEESGIFVCNSGLDMVEQFDHQGKFIRLYPMGESDVWQRFSPSEDYRFVPQIEPREAHPNYILRRNGTLLVNCPNRRCVADLYNRRPVISGFPNMMHDGSKWRDNYVWTTTDGKLVIVDAASMEITEQIDLQALYRWSEPGWCRGLEIVEDLALIAFTRFRKPSKKKFLNFAVRGQKILTSHILAYDLQQRKFVEDWFLPRPDTIVYGIYRIPDDRFKD